MSHTWTSGQKDKEWLWTYQVQAAFFVLHIIYTCSKNVILTYIKSESYQFELNYTFKKIILFNCRFQLAQMDSLNILKKKKKKKNWTLSKTKKTLCFFFFFWENLKNKKDKIHLNLPWGIKLSEITKIKVFISKC